jgi:hypothetical protein
MTDRSDDPRWAEVPEAEKSRIEARRRWLTARGWQCPQPSHNIGLALSGGGIRSATFSLGLMKSLSKAKLFHSVDYLSTVSGGGYAGSFYCSLFVPPAMRGPSPPAAAATAGEAHAAELGEDLLGSLEGRSALTQLREGGHYLAPNGVTDALFAAVIAIRNWLAVALVTGFSLLAFFLLSYLALAAVQKELLDAGEWLGVKARKDNLVGAWLILLLLLSFWPLACGWAFWFARSDPVPVSRLKRPLSIQMIVAFLIAVATLPHLWAPLISQRISLDWLGNPPKVLPGGWFTPWGTIIGLISLAAIAFYLLAVVSIFRKERRRRRGSSAAGGLESHCAIAEEDRVRSELSHWALIGTFALAAAAVLGAISWLGRYAYTDLAVSLERLDTVNLVTITSSVTAFVPLARWILKRHFGAASTGTIGQMLLRRAGRLTALVAGFLLLTILVTFWAAMAHAALHQFQIERFSAEVTALVPEQTREERIAQEASYDRPRLLANVWSPLTDVAAELVPIRGFWSPVAKTGRQKLEVGLTTLDLDRRSTGFWSPDTLPALIFALSVLVCAVLFGHIDSLLNQSSLASFYGSRLRRAYLGASNRRRWQGPKAIVDDASPDVPGMRRTIRRLLARIRSALPGETAPSDGGASGAHSRRATVDREDPADDIQLRLYYHETVRAPVHLINVTINETTNKSSRVIQRDRKGKPMTVGPGGYHYPRDAPGGNLSLIGTDEAEVLPLSSWIGISGAAFSTGTGFHTSLGTALLAGLANLRLGYWWYSRKRAKFGTWGRPARWVQSYLLREVRGSFQGSSAQRWYLSDGGHHENSGIYELIRRRVGFIVASDNGADPAYQFGDIVNLIRKLRIDFDAEVEFLDKAELKELFDGSALRHVFGTLDQIRQRGEEEKKATDDDTPPPAPGPYATLARIRYLSQEDTDLDTPASTLVLIKPRITGRELPDLVRYQNANASFPQQPTTDQFFDEAQWESYYRLGQLIGDMVFDKNRFDEPHKSSDWRPWSLTRLPEPRPSRAPPRPRRAKKPPP